MPLTHSDAWQYFTRSSDKKSATCNLCGANLTYMGSTSNLLNDVNNKHQSSAFSNDPQSPMSSFVSTPKKVSASESERITCTTVKD
ncbi:hypothetical protein DPMN_015742 [Dreissena polymorpha]|uniref:BED-type domain-containing protein n=1 Tax=Dreissena polymorpha TaxID=45954 RepID=A0A9D4N8C5_DREPO|nr:hypothetical protein DPMN_015742 [Dreissena polymorpha]